MKSFGSASSKTEMWSTLVVLHLLLAILTSQTSGEPTFLSHLAPTSESILEDGQYTLQALMYFEDDGDNITGSDIRIYSSPEVGRVEVDEGTGDITFTASENDFGNRTFSYYACNSAGNCSQVANFTIVITPVNDPPSFGITNLTVLEDTIVSLNLPQDLNVTDPEDVLSADSFSVVTMPQVGMLEYAGGTLVYTPPLNYYTTANSPVSFVLMVCDRDNVQLCVNETISLILTPVSDAGAANSSLPQSSTIGKMYSTRYIC